MGAADSVTKDEETPNPDPCLQNRHWYAFLCSSLITFFTGLLLVLTWRILTWLFCQKNEPAEGEEEGKKSEDFAAQADAEVGWVTEAKDWAGELISGQTTTGRILVSQLSQIIIIYEYIYIYIYIYIYKVKIE